jgi:long-chain fatty acid transport protein
MWHPSSFVNNTITRARIKVVDIAPGLGYQVTDKLALGVGLDVEKVAAELNFILVSEPSLNKAYDTAYGYHAGAIYEFSPATRLGLAYHSKVAHHLKGTSIFVENSFSRVSTNLYLPPDTTLSLYHSLNAKWAVMATVVYTQWDIVKGLTIRNIAGIEPIALYFPQNFHNTFTYSVGADYQATDHLTLRAGAGYDQTPTSNAFRILQLPDSDRYDLSIGGHYQVNKNLGLDMGWTRVFLQRTAINPPLHPELYPLVLQNTVSGRTKASGDVVGIQIKWDFV